MTSWIESPPKQKGMGCLGKGCLLIVAFLVLLIIAFVIGFYVGTKPKEIPQVPTSEEEQNAVRARWDEFEAANRNEPAMSPAVPQPAPASDTTPAPDATPVPAETPASANRIELSANDINQLIARGRHTRGKAFVSIDNNVARVQVTIPLDKAGFNGRYLNGGFEVRAPQDHNPRSPQVSLTGLPDGLVNTLLGSRSFHNYVDEFVSEHGITSFAIENNKVILETAGGR